jgi:hypothetical protein
MPRPDDEQLTAHETRFAWWVVAIAAVVLVGGVIVANGLLIATGTGRHRGAVAGSGPGTGTALTGHFTEAPA